MIGTQANEIQSENAHLAWGNDIGRREDGAEGRSDSGQRDVGWIIDGGTVPLILVKRDGRGAGGLVVPDVGRRTRANPVNGCSC